MLSLLRSIEMYVQESMPKRLSIKPGILEQVQKRYQGILHFTTEEADNAFMEIVRSWTLHGSAVFEVNVRLNPVPFAISNWSSTLIQQSYSNELPSSCWMAVNSEGVHILPKRGKDPILTHPYANILSFVPSPTGILLLTDSQDEGKSS